MYFTLFLLLNRRGLTPTDYKFILKGTGSYNILLRNKERNEKKSYRLNSFTRIYACTCTLFVISLLR
jgi:hypothetical protein